MERSSVENGIWLCQNCAKLVDNDPITFSAGLLRGWKDKAEQSAFAEIGKTRSHDDTVVIDDKWIDLGYLRESGVQKRCEEEGYQVGVVAADQESRKIDLQAWEYVLVEQDGKKYRLKIRDHPAIGGYLVVLKKRKTD